MRGSFESYRVSLYYCIKRRGERKLHNIAKKNESKKTALYCRKNRGKKATGVNLWLNKEVVCKNFLNLFLKFANGVGKEKFRRRTFSDK